MQSTAEQLEDITIFNDFLKNCKMLKYTIDMLERLIIKLSSESYKSIDTMGVFDKVFKLMREREAMIVLYNKLIEIIKSCNPNDRKIFNYYYLNQESAYATAYVLGIPLSTVKYRINYLYNKLYNKLYTTENIKTMKLILNN